MKNLDEKTRAEMVQAFRELAAVLEVGAHDENIEAALRELRAGLDGVLADRVAT